MHWEEHDFALPALPPDLKWAKVLDTVSDRQEEGENGRTAAVAGRSIQILKQRKNGQRKTEGGTEKEVTTGKKAWKHFKTITYHKYLVYEGLLLQSACINRDSPMICQSILQRNSW